MDEILVTIMTADLFCHRIAPCFCPDLEIYDCAVTTVKVTFLRQQVPTTLLFTSGVEGPTVPVVFCFACFAELTFKRSIVFALTAVIMPWNLLPDSYKVSVWKEASWQTVCARSHRGAAENWQLFPSPILGCEHGQKSVLEQIWL